MCPSKPTDSVQDANFVRGRGKGFAVAVDRLERLGPLEMIGQTSGLNPHLSEVMGGAGMVSQYDWAGTGYSRGRSGWPGTVNSQPLKRNITSPDDILWLSETQQVTGRILGIKRRFDYFDAFPGGHKKSPDCSGLGVSD
jgi:hypothetical protein